MADLNDESKLAEAPDFRELFVSLGRIRAALDSGFAMKDSAESLEAMDGLSLAAARTRAGQEEVRPDSAAAAGAAAALADLEARAAACTACVLAAGRNKPVFGEGVPEPLVLVVGEGPGAEEDRQGLPFVGASGQLLDRMLASIGLSRRENAYIANVVKCRPPGNREPAPDERAACMPFLKEQIALLKPRAILCAGRTAAQAMLDTKDGINKLRGSVHYLGAIPMIATYHPSALLRDESLKRPAWEDLKALKALLGSLDAD